MEAQIKTNQRIRFLDIFRGFAILGTLGTNIWIFANLGDISFLFFHGVTPWWGSIDDLLRSIVLFLVNGKFLGMLTIMFGIGLEIKYQQALRKGYPWPRLYLWTASILLLEGVLHFMLVMEYDILMSYAITAMIVSFIVKKGDRAIKKGMIFFGGVHALLLLLLFSALAWINAPQSGANVNLFEGTAEVIALYQNGTWVEQIQYRLANFWELRSEAIFVLPLNVFLFLTGVRLMRSGAFSDTEQGRRIRTKMMRLGLMLGIPLNLLIFIPGGLFDLPVRYFFAPILALGYMGLLAKLVEKRQELRLWTGLECVGKMALSCYVLQNIACSFLFYGWGLGLGGKLHALWIILLWLGLSILQLCFAALWLRKFKHGPMETVRKILA